MLIVRAPVRLSLAGGGTDFPVYYERYGGLVVSTTIDKYFYVFVSRSGPDGVQISSSDYRLFSRHRRGAPPLWDGDLGLVKAALHEFGCDAGLALFLASEVPPGTGLGSSSTVAVALVKALATLRGLALSPAEVAHRACVLELERLRSPIGKQDQYAAAFGGLNAIAFTREGVAVEPLRLAPETQARLQARLLLFFTGAARSANTILREQRQASANEQGAAVAALHRIKAAAEETLRCLRRGDVRSYGEILAESWEQKKRLASGISNAKIDELYELARRRGAIGGKLAGAGGGGFLLLYCEPACHLAVTEALEQAGLFRMAYRFERGGAQVLMNALARPLPRAPFASREVVGVHG
ncbi:MAG TPA: GHMP kinase [Chloroflexota bacterium]|nr:GHMP kinase [Chloroflexota bacterium]